jgi:hypothetical protein
MRTVHETEALRPSDPVPKSHPSHPQNTGLLDEPVFSKNSGREPKTSGHDEDDSTHGRSVADEKRFLKHKLAWAQAESDRLRTTLEWLEQQKKRCFVKKELLLERVLRQELGDSAAQEILR